MNLKNNKLINNFINLSVIQAASMLLQILIYPYLNNVIGPVNYGVIIYQQIIVLFLQVFVIFGTDLTSISLVSKHKYNRKKLSIIFSKIIYGRTILAAVISFFYVIYIIKNDIPNIFLINIIFLFESAFSSKWFFHGVQNLKPYTLFFVIFRLLGVLSTFILVVEINDWKLVVLINALVSLLTSILLFFYMKRNVNFVIIKVRNVIVFFLYSKELFFTNLMSQIKDRSGGIIIAHVLGLELLVYYDFCIKIVGVISSFLSSVSAACYPNFTEKFSIVSFDKISRKLIVISAIPFILLFLFGKEISQLINFLININIYPISSILYVFGVMIFVRSHGYYLGLCYLMVHNKRKEYSKTLIYSSVIYITMILLYSIQSVKTLNLFGAVLTASLLFEYLHRYFYYYKCRFNNV